MVKNNIQALQPILRANSLTKQVQTGETQLTILQNINLEINAGEAVAIIVLQVLASQLY